MRKKIFFAVAVVVAAASVGYAAYLNQKVEMTDMMLENVEALSDEEWGCADCDECTGEYYVCESDYDKFWSDAEKNCSSLNITLHLISGC